MLLSLQTGLNLVNAAVVCAILGSIPGLEPSSDVTKPRYFYLFVDATGVICHQLVFSALNSMSWGCVGFVETFN